MLLGRRLLRGVGADLSEPVEIEMAEALAVEANNIPYYLNLLAEALLVRRQINSGPGAVSALADDVITDPADPLDMAHYDTVSTTITGAPPASLARSSMCTRSRPRRSPSTRSSMGWPRWTSRPSHRATRCSGCCASSKPITMWSAVARGMHSRQSCYAGSGSYARGWRDHVD